MITYNDIYEALRKEKYSEQLQQLPSNFIEEVADYLKEKKNISEKKEDMFSDAITKTKKQLENAVSIFREIMLRRKRKLLNLSFIACETGISKADFESMMSFEKEIFDKIVKNLEAVESNVAEMLNGKGKKTENILVAFKENVSEFLDANGELIGPFEKGEVSNLPEEIAKILQNAGKVEYIDGGAEK